jgi:hypothetical protein
MMGLLRAGQQEYTGRRRDGSEVPVEISLTTFEREGTLATVLIARDVTERRRAERMERARDRAEEASEAKTLYLASMSHEIRTPLNAVIGYSELLAEELEDVGHTALVPDALRIERAGNHLLSLINGVLDLSKIESGRMEVLVDEVDLEEVVEQLRSTLAPLAEEHDNTLLLSHDDDVETMYTDATKLRQILFNLLSNAIKFTRSGTVEMCVERGRTEDGREMARFVVSDTGIGMNDEQLERVFEPFQQAESTTSREHGGTGLGLTLTRSFCELLGGELEARSTPGEGTTFVATLPVRVA